MWPWRWQWWLFRKQRVPEAGCFPGEGAGPVVCVPIIMPSLLTFHNQNWTAGEDAVESGRALWLTPGSSRQFVLTAAPPGFPFLSSFCKVRGIFTGIL